MTGVSAARLRRILAILVLLLPIHLQIGSTPAPGTDEILAQTSIFASQSGLNLDIPDGAYTGVLASMAASPIEVSDFGPYSGRIKVNIWMDHLAAGDLVIKLQGPNGALITLLSRPGLDELTDGGCGGSASQVSKTVNPLSFYDLNLVSAETMDAGPDGVIGDPSTSNPHNFTPARDSEPPPDDLASAFAGDPANGVWTLYLGDACGNGKTGSLDAWNLEIQPAADVMDVNDIPTRGLAFAIDNTAGAGGAIQALAARYGASTPLRKVIAQMLDEAGASPDPGFNALVESYLRQLSYSTPDVSTLTLADFSNAQAILVDDTQVITLQEGWGSGLDGVWLRPNQGFLYAFTPGALIDLGVRATPYRDYREITNAGPLVTRHSTRYPLCRVRQLLPTHPTVPANTAQINTIPLDIERFGSIILAKLGQK